MFRLHQLFREQVIGEIFLCLDEHAFTAPACPGVLGITRKKLEGFKVQGQGFVGPVEFKKRFGEIAQGVREFNFLPCLPPIENGFCQKLFGVSQTILFEIDIAQIIRTGGDSQKMSSLIQKTTIDL